MPTDNYTMLIDKLDAFIRKYYRNRLLKGAIYSLALLLSFYLILALTESVAWFSPSVRTVLFWTYVAAAAFILWRFVLIPLFRLFKAGKRISRKQAAVIIGKHFPEVQDKLLNTLQLHDLAENSPESRDLILASIRQKSAQLTPVPFLSAIDLGRNRRYLVYVAPALLVIALLLVASPVTLTAPSQRLIKHNRHFEKPLPFEMVVENKTLEVVEQEDIDINVRLVGDEIPDQVFIKTNGAEYRMVKNSNTKFAYTFAKIPKDQTFTLTAAGYESKEYTISVVPRPMLINFYIQLTYPAYIGRQSEKLSNSGDLVVPAGTNITWSFQTRSASELDFTWNGIRETLRFEKSNTAAISRRAHQPSGYSVAIRNSHMLNPDSLVYSVNVIPDLHPAITVEEKSDSVLDNRKYYRGLIRDDYGFRNLDFKVSATDPNGKTQIITTQPVQINPGATAQEFYYFFDFASLKAQGSNLSYYFEIWDNDAVNGSKSTRSEVMSFRLPDMRDLQKEVEASNENLKAKLEHNMEEAKRIQKELEALKRKLYDNTEFSFQDRKQLQELIDRQKQIRENIEQLQLEREQVREKELQFKDVNESLLQKQQELDRLFREALPEEMKKMFEELQKMLDQANKDKVNEMIDQMKMSAEDMEKQLDRNLELFKQLEFDKRLNDNIEALDKLAEEQDKLAEETEKSKQEKSRLLEKQQELSEQMKELQKDLQETEKKNEELEDPNDFENPEEEMKDAGQDMQDSENEMRRDQMRNSSQKQRSASQKMRKISAKLKSMQFQMEQEGLTEDIRALRQILKNLVKVSFDQEELIDRTRVIQRSDPKYGQIMEDQKRLQDNLRMVEDSLIALSKRQMMVKPFVTREISAIDENLERSLTYLQDRNVSSAMGRQQLVMTAVNNLALLLSESLNQMESMSSGSGSSKGVPKPSQGKQGNAKTLRQMQERLNQQMERVRQGLEQQHKSREGQTPQMRRQMSESMARMAAEQEALRRRLQEYRDELIKEGQIDTRQLNQAIQQMEQTERDLVNKILNEQVMRRQEQIKTRLLESERAEQQREQEQKRESTTGREFTKPDPVKYFHKDVKFNAAEEQLRTIPANLQPYYRNKVNEYFINIPSK